MIKRKCFSIILISVMFFCILINIQKAWASDSDFIINSTGTIIYYSGLGGDVIIPSTIDGVKVTSIGFNAFNGYTGLTSIRLPKGVTNIGDWAFKGCTDLTSISIPQGVTSIGNAAFLDCTDLTSISIPQGVTSIGEDVFSGCTNLRSINIPQGVTTIDRCAFSFCTSLKTINLPQGVKSIGYYAFCGCTGLTNITINSATTTIFDDAFTIPDTAKIIGNDPSTAKDYATKYNRSFKSLFEVTQNALKQSVPSYYFDNGIITGYKGPGDVIIPETIGEKKVTAIGRNIFSGCTGLTSITLYSATTTINDSEDTIPNTVTIIGYDPSTAKDYAIKYNRLFKIIGSDTTNALNPSDTSKAIVDNVVVDKAAATNIVVYFPDSNLEKVIRNAIKKPTGDILKSDVNNLIELEASGKHIVNLTGIENLTNLQNLNLSHNQISSIESLRGLTNLVDLKLDLNKITNIEPLKNLIRLETLSLGVSTTTDIKPLVDNMIVNIEPLKGLTNLTSLSFGLCPIRDFAPLDNLKKITSFSWGDTGGLAYCEILAKKVSKIIHQIIKSNMTEYEKELAIHDYIVNNTKYDASSIADASESTVLLKGVGMCQGYAEATSLLLDYAGIKNIVINGVANNGTWGGHDWNLVQIDGFFYHLDTTWDGSPSNYSYFNLTDKIMREDHRWDPLKYPACTDNKYKFKNKRK